MREAELLEIAADVAANVHEHGPIGSERLEQGMMGEDVDPARLLRLDAAHEVVECLAFLGVVGVVSELVAVRVLRVLEGAVGGVPWRCVLGFGEVLGCFVVDRKHGVVA